MPRKKVRRKRRRFNAHPCELAWLKGEPYPEDDEAEAFLFFDCRLRELDTAISRGVRSPDGFEPLTANIVAEMKGVERWRTLYAQLRRLRELYDSAPQNLRAAVPDDRRKLLEAVDAK